MNKLEADLYCDAGSRGNPGPAGIGVVILNTHTQKTIAETSIYLGVTTNNAAEYMGLIHGLQLAQQHGVNRINIYLDSMLVVNHINGTYKVRNSRLSPLYARALDLLKLFGDGYVITHIPRAKNARADELANIAMNRGE
jgi:ribonuclease HI